MVNGFDSPAILWILVAAQIVGIVTACAARLSQGASQQALVQSLFLGVLAVMGAATIAAFAVGPGCWLACSATLAVMILTVTCDFRNGRKAATW
jgi:hypothetical protein